MGRGIRPVSMILCLLGVLSGPSLAQTQEPPSSEESHRQRIGQLQQEFQQRAQERRERMIQQQEEFWQRFFEQERQRLQKSLPGLPEEERQRRLESLRQREERQRQSLQRQREVVQHTGEMEKQSQQRAEEARRRHQEERELIQKVADEYADEVWREALGATPEQWTALKPRLERIRQLKDSPYVDLSVYWIAGSTSYQEESLVRSPDAAQSVAKASGWFSVTKGAGSTSESYIRSGADGGDRNTPIENGHYFSIYSSLPSGQYWATTRTGSRPGDSNRPTTRMAAPRAGSEPRRAVARGAIEFGMQVPGPIRKQVGDIALGWQWERPSLDKGPDALSESERVCERLVEVLELKDADPEQVRQRVEALRRLRAQRQAQLREAQRQLREVITPEQEPKLVLMGYLD